MKDNRGFTLIELLAVVIILGVVMLIAIPSVTKQITNSRRITYADNAKTIISGAKNIVNSGELPVYKPKTTYYLPIEMISTENGKRSPFGEFVDAYVVVIPQKDGYDYYWTSTDTSKTGILLTHYDNLDKDSIKNNIDAISTDVSICGNDNIIIFNTDGTIKEEKESTECINPKSTYDGSGSVVSNSLYFDVDSSGTITRVHDLVHFELLDVDRCVTYLQNAGFNDTVERVKYYCENELKNEVNDEDEFFKEMKSQGIITYYIEPYPKDLVIPEQINGVEVTSIGSEAFLWAKVNSITLPKTLKRIESNALSGLGLKRLVIPNGVTHIGSGALSGNYFSKIIIPSSVTEIGGGALYNCPVLYEVINKTDRGYNWTSVFGHNGDTHMFKTGTYKHAMTEEAFRRNGRYFYDPYHVTIYVTNEDSMNINIDSMFDIGPYKFDLVNTNGYKVFSYDLSSNSYLETSPGPMNRIEGYCGALLTNYYITDSSGSLLYEGFYRFVIENAMC